MSELLNRRLSQHKNGPIERDPVAVYKMYSEKRLDVMNKPDALYYLGINYTKNYSSNKLWIKSSKCNRSEHIEQFDENHGGKKRPFK